MKTSARWLMFGCLICAAARAADPTDVPEEKTRPSDDDLRIRGVFDSVLPRTEMKNSLRFIVHPHLGDLTKRDHIRTALGLRYGLTKDWEASAEVDSYFTHGLRHGSFFDDSGFSFCGTEFRALGTVLLRDHEVLL